MQSKAKMILKKASSNLKSLNKDLKETAKKFKKSVQKEASKIAASKHVPSANAGKKHLKKSPSGAFTLSASAAVMMVSTFLMF